MSTQEVCRLCLSKGNLLCVFDKRIEGTNLLKDVILITTGVEIHSEDVITRKICSTCSQDAVKMYQFRQKSLKNDKYLKAQYRQLLKRTDLKISDTNVTSNLKSVHIEEKKQEPRPMPSYRVHPTMISLSRKYPKLQFPSICVLSNVDPCVCIEMDKVENYFKSRNLNLKKYAHLALIASNKNISNKSSAKTSEKKSEYSVNHGINDHVVRSTPSAILETVDNNNRVMPINIKLNQSGYTIVRPSTENIINGKGKNVCESTSSCEQLITDSSEPQSEIRRANKRRLSDCNLLSEPEIKKVSSGNPSKMISVLSNIEIKSPSVFKCNICGLVQFSAKHLKKHRIRHSRCKFCKTQFKSVEMKQQHIKNSCLVKETLDNKTHVEVERIDLNMNIRLQHRDAFATIAPPPELEKKDSTPVLSEAAEEIIEIISDDEETPISTLTPICSTVIRPFVRMKNDDVLDSIKTPAPDMEIIKELLTKFKNIQSVTDEATQTELSTTESIRIDEENLTTELINVKQILHLYQVPVEIRKGSKISASYNYQRSQPKPKKLKLWTDLTPLDVETENNSVSNQTANGEHIITVTPATHSNNTTKDSDLANKANSCDSSSNDQTSLQNIGTVTPVSSNGSYSTSDSLQTKSPAITPTQIESLTPTPECLSVVQAKPLATIPTQSSPNAEMQNKRNLPASPHVFQIFPVQATSPITDNPSSRHSPKSSGIDQLTSHMNSNTVETQSVPTSSPSGRIPSSADQTTLIPTSCALCYVNSGTPRKSPVQNNTDLNSNWSLSNSHCGVMGCTIMTRNDSADRTIEYVVNNYSKSVCTGTTNVRPPNGVTYSNNNQQTSSHNSQARPKSMMIQWNQNARQHFETATTNYHNINSTNSNVSSQNPYGNNRPIQNTSLANHNVYFERPQSYPNASTLVNQTAQSYISSHTRTIAQAVDTTKSVHTADGHYNAYLQCPRVQEPTSFQTVVGVTGTYMPNAPSTSEVHHRQTGHSTVSNRLQNIRPPTKVSESFDRYGNEPSSAFPHYSKSSNYVNGSITVSPVSQNFDVINKNLSNACAYQPIPTSCETSPSDKSQYFSPGLIRVRNVCELT